MSVDASLFPDEHPVLPMRKTGVLLINLGTPDAPTTPAVKRYLRQFLSDTRVIELNKWLWRPILEGPILTFRSPKTAGNYAKIWQGDSPLRAGTQQIAEALEAELCSDMVMIEWAMRYGDPSVPEKLNVLQNAGCDQILCVALYPQYSAATTASAYDAVFDYAKSARWQPTLRTTGPYHDHPQYIAALKASIDQTIERLEWTPDAILASFHGLPEENLHKGDPYHCQCQKTARLLREAMGMDADHLITTFQSRFGPKEWLKPYTDDTAQRLAEQGKKNLLIISPGFAADCLETLEELAMGTREIFLDAGGQNFHYVPALNKAPEAVELYRQIIETNLAGWVDLTTRTIQAAAAE